MEQLTITTSQINEFQDVTAKIQEIIRKKGFNNGICQVFVPHTTAGVTINENADPDVVKDLLYGLDRIFPAFKEYRHLEGNSAAHLKSSLIGCSLTIPVENGRLCLGKWQGIYFCEFDGPRTRKLFVQLIEGK
ncbi:MAG TPA: YjbQ family protein [Clostridia bacterium]|jgi:secondary thiamine-phosphate synthase enzyme|nr:YjbQ family protein [Clostridia bacterium]